MHRGAIPDGYHPARHLALQVLEKGHDVYGIARPILTVAIPLAFERDRPDGREMIAGVPLSQDGCVGYGCVSADDAREGGEPRFVDEEEALALGLCPFWRAGQVSWRQCVIVASSRWRARRAGFCGLQRITWHKRLTWRG
jgi:hypothetical protein